MNTTTTTTTIAKLPTNRGAAGEIETSAMANCLMLLSSQHAALNSVVGGGGKKPEEEVGRKFPCKTCGQKFSSFQALGGHRASHKKTRPAIPGEENIPAKPKVHACSICGVEFPTGQALGGHMRRHRRIDSGCDGGGSAAVSNVTSEGSSENSDGNHDGEKKRKIVMEVPILKKSSSSKRVCLDNIDLNLSLWRNEGVIEVNNNGGDPEIEGEIVEQHEDEEDFLKLELRLPSN